MNHASLHTLRYRQNQTETAVLAARVQRNGYRVVKFSEPADLLILNTSSVTKDAERHIESTLSILFAEGKMDGLKFWATANFLNVGVPSNNDLTNRLKEVGITRASDYWAMGQLTAERQPMRRMPVL